MSDDPTASGTADAAPDPTEVGAGATAAVPDSPESTVTESAGAETPASEPPAPTEPATTGPTPASEPAPAEPEPVYAVVHRAETVGVRRSPKYSVFLVAGAAVGLIVALILTFGFHGTNDPSPNTELTYSTGQVFGFLALGCVAAGVALGALVALAIDRFVGRRIREYTVDHEHIAPLDRL